MKTALKRIFAVLKWILLILFGIFVLTVFGIPAFVIGVIAKFWRKKVGKGFDDLAEELRPVGVIIDILGAYTIFNWLWFIIKTKDGYRFAQNYETVSYVLWRNKKENTLRYLGSVLYDIIEFLDKGHFDVFEK